MKTVDVLSTARPGYDGTLNLTAAETAKLVRVALKKQFPGVKFSVRSETYSGGASIDVSWVDGPVQKTVQDVIGVFAGSGFDGMIDMKFHKTHWVEPDGTTYLASTPGTEGSRGSVPSAYTDPPSATARLVNFHADYVFAQRKTSPEFEAAALKLLEEKLGQPLPTDPREQWNLTVPLLVNRDGELFRMVDSQQETLGTVLNALCSHRTGEEVLGS